MAPYAQLALLLRLLRDAFHLCAPWGRLRTVASGRAERPLLLDLLAEIDAAVWPTLLHTLRAHLDALWVPCAQVASLPIALLALVSQQI
jgi:hypothetical protein